MTNKRLFCMLLTFVTVIMLWLPVAAAQAADGSTLAAPQITSATANGTSVTVTWGKVKGAEKYRLFYKKNGKWTKLKDTTGTSVTLNGTLGKTYTYTVRCLSSDGTTYTSGYDAIGKSVTVTQLNTPQITSVTANGTSVTVTWGKVKGAEKYRLFYKKNGKWTKLKDTTGTSVTLNGTAGKTYIYTVRCINSAGTKYTSAYDAAGKSITLKLATPKITDISGNAGNVKVTWSAVSGAAKYRLFYKTSGGWKSLGDTTATSMVCPKAKAGTTYTFTVRCLSADGKSYTSAYDTKGTSYTVNALSTPTVAAVSNSADGVIVTWYSVPNAVKYRVFYKIGSGSWKSAGDTTRTSYTWKAAQSGTTYSFTVRCVNQDGTAYTSGYDAVGKSITYSNSIKFPAPDIVMISRVGDVESWQISWTDIYDGWSGKYRYRLMYKTENSAWKQLTTTGLAHYTWSGWQDGVTYTFAVCCIDSNGNIVSDYGKKMSYRYETPYTFTKLSLGRDDFGPTLTFTLTNTSTEAFNSLYGSVIFLDTVNGYIYADWDGALIDSTKDAPLKPGESRQIVVRGWLSGDMASKTRAELYVGSIRVASCP